MQTAGDDAIADLLLPPASTPTLTPRVHMFVRSGPLPRTSWEALTGREPVVQLPWLVQPVALAYKGAAGLKLSPCTLAKIMLGTITDWSDPQVGGRSTIKRV